MPVPDEAFAVVRGDIEKFPPADRIRISQDESGVKLTAEGIGGHASHAEGTINALV